MPAVSATEATSHMLQGLSLMQYGSQQTDGFIYNLWTQGIVYPGSPFDVGASTKSERKMDGSLRRTSNPADGPMVSPAQSNLTNVPTSLTMWTFGVEVSWRHRKKKQF
jgi:hypothetical protein